jgi:hypothetical protein
MGMNHTRFAVTATALVAAVVVAGLFVLHGGPRPAAIQVLTANGRPSQAASPTTSTPAQPAVQPVASQLAGFACGATTIAGGQPVPSALITAVRAASHPGYDRLVVEFSTMGPGRISITPQQNATFVNSPRGNSVTIAGRAGLLVVIRGADAHTSYAGPITFKPNGLAIVEVRTVEDFEGQVGFALGLAKSPCYRAFTLSSPTRLVIDVQVG